MGKKIFGLTLAMIVIILLVIGILAFNRKENVVWITDNEFLYDIAKEYVINEKRNNDPDKDEINYNVFADYEGFGIEIKDNKKYVYMWIFEESCYENNDELNIGSGSSMPYKFTFENNKIINYQIPEDGSYYVKSIKDMFPDSIENEVLSFEMDNSKLEEQVKEYYSYLENINNNSDTVAEFIGTVIQVEDKYIIVEPDEGSNESKSTNKISIGTTKWNAEFEVDNKVKITYDGIIQTTFPAQIHAQEIELIE